MKTVTIGDKKVGDGHPCFISFEAGATHAGIEDAKKMVKAAAESGADAVKFQTCITEELMSDDYMISFETPDGKKQEESVFQALKRRELTFDEWRELKAYCDDLGILFISTPTGKSTVDLLSEIGAAAIKVSKADINHRYLIDYMAQKNLPMILDARERFEDVEMALQICEKHNVSDVVVMHCPSGYPATQAGIHLSTIPVIKSLFGFPVAYSDHSIGSSMNYAAIGLGANFLEKTITLNKSTRAVEHTMSLELDELKPFVDSIREVEAALGNPRIIMSSRVNAQHRRSIQVSRDIQKGEVLSINDLAFKRPGTHLSVDQYESVVGKTVTSPISAGSFISWDHIQ
ncbi:N-acetylneuraminate synthase [bacterium]|nr:N-acetylneuraminate synthase [bacterium]